jgi:hypothetical protein
MFAAFAQFAAEQGLSIRDPQALQQFRDAVHGETKRSLDNDIFVFGFRAETMFETVVAGLGDVKLIKQEDTGNAYFDGELKIPDFRIVLRDGKQVLVEVKNYCQKDAFDPYELNVDYLRKLESYAAMSGFELLLAVYWLKWNIWTLVSPSALVIEDDVAKLEFGDAMMTNQMRRLGDYMIGTRSPLRFRVEVDETGRNGDQRQLVIRQVSMLSGDQRIIDPVESRIAFTIIFHGSWQEEEIVETNDEKLTAIEYRYAPGEDRSTQQEQGFEMVGPVSGIISKFYREGTAKDGRVKGFHVDFTPGQFGRLIPADYFDREHVLPLWRFELQHTEKSSLSGS